MAAVRKVRYSGKRIVRDAKGNVTKQIRLKPNGAVYFDQHTMLWLTARAKALRQEVHFTAHVTYATSVSHPGVTGDLYNLHPRIAAGLQKFAVITGHEVYIRDGWRSYAEEVYRWNLYRSGRGPLAAYPGTSKHGRTPAQAADCGVQPGNVHIRSWDGGRGEQVLRMCGLHTPLPSEPWHVEIA